VKNITIRREDFWTTEMPSREMVKSLNPPKKKDWTSLSSSLELCQFHLREDSGKLPASRVIDPSRPGQDLETCKSRTECRKWVISDALPKARGVFVSQGLLLEFSHFCFSELWGYLSHQNRT